MNRNEISDLFNKWVKKLRIENQFDCKLEFVNDVNFKKTGDLKIDIEDSKAIIMLNESNPFNENFEEVIIHELMHLKLYPLDQFAEMMIIANYENGSKEQNIMYHNFFVTLEKTVEELTKCYLLEFGGNKELSYGRCKNKTSFNELYKKLKSLE